MHEGWGLKRKGFTTYSLELASSSRSSEVCRILIHQRKIPVCGRQAREGADERQKNDHEDDVGAETAHQEDQTHQSHKHQKKRKTGKIPRLLQPQRIARIAHTCGRLRGIGDVGAIGVEPRYEGKSEGEPEGAEGAEHHEGEGVADDPLADGTEEH